MPSARHSSPGYAAIDALAALAILATTISLSITGLATARRMADTALEATRARTTVTSLLNQQAMPPGLYSGRTAQFDWTLAIEEESAPTANARLCRKQAALTGLKSGRRYTVETHDFCASPREQPVA